MSSASVTLTDYWRLARSNRNFRRLWLAQIISEIGDWFYSLAIYSLLLQLTGRASSVALALVLQVLPQTFVGPMAGIINDRISRRKVMIFADLFRMAVVASMLLVRSASVVWLVYPLLFLETVMAAFFEPARNSVIPSITAEEDVIVANTLASTTWSFNLAIGSLLGGAVAALLGRDAVFVLNALSFLASALLISRMSFVESHVAGRGKLQIRELFDYSPIVDGVRYISSDRKLLATVMLKGGIGLLGTAWVIFPVMGQRVFPLRGFELAPERAALFSMSLLMGARGVGALIGPLIASHWAGRRQSRLRLGVLIGFVLGGLGYALLGLAPSLLLACLAVVLSHVGASTVWVFSTTMLHLNAENRFRGRVFSADLAIVMFTIACAAWSAGQAVDYGFSSRTVAIATGLAMSIPAIAWAITLRRWPKQVEDRELVR